MTLSSHVAHKRHRENGDYDAVDDEEQTIENHRQLTPLGPRGVA